MNITGSSLPLLRNCQWWARPEVIAPPAEPPTEAMQLGTEVHAAIEATLAGEKVAELSPDGGDYLVNWWQWMHTKPFGEVTLLPEVAYAYDPHKDASRKLGARMARKYEVGAHEIAGTIDAVAIDGARGVVIDWKTGMDFAGLTADAQDNWQLRLYALAVSRAHKLDEVRVAIVRITPWGVKMTDYLLDAFELDAVAEEVKALVLAVPKSEPKAGGHCRRCKAVTICPTTAKATEIIAPATPVTLEITSDEQATALLLRLRQVQAACEQMETVLKAYATEKSGIALDNGKRWTKVPQDRESINLTGADMAAGLAALDAAGVMEAVETKSTVTKAAIERAMKAKGLKGKELKAAMDALLGDLRASGVMRSTVVDAWREV